MLNIAHLEGFESLAHSVEPLSHFLRYFLFPCSNELSLLYINKKFSQGCHPDCSVFVFDRTCLLAAV